MFSKVNIFKSGNSKKKNLKASNYSSAFHFQADIELLIGFMVTSMSQGRDESCS